MGALPVRLRSIPLWEQQWNKAALQKKLEESERAYARGFKLLAYSDEELSFPAFQTCYSYGVALGELQRNNWPAFTGVDISSTSRPGNAIVTVKVEPLTHRRFPIDIRFGSWKSNELAMQLTEVNSLYNPTVIKVEDNATQQAVIDWVQALKYSYWYKIEGTTTGSNKHSQTLGLPALQVEFYNHAWVVPHAEYEHASLVDMERNAWVRWDYEFRNHPTAATGDGVMATWFCRQGIEEHGYAFETVRNNTER